MAFLEVDSVTKYFGGLSAVNEVTCVVEKGKITGLIGPNGSGKTTLFNLITGFIRPTSGSIRFEGRDITGVPPQDLPGRHRENFSAQQAFQQHDSTRERHGRQTLRQRVDPEPQSSQDRLGRVSGRRWACRISGGCLLELSAWSTDGGWRWPGRWPLGREYSFSMK